MKHTAFSAGLWIALAVAAPLRAAPIDDARSALEKLNNIGDYGKSAAEQAVAQARADAEKVWPAARDAANRRLNEIRQGLDRLRRDAATVREKSAGSGIAINVEKRQIGSAQRDKEIATRQAERDANRKYVQAYKNAASDGKLTAAERAQMEKAQQRMAALDAEIRKLKEQDAKLDRTDRSGIDAGGTRQLATTERRQAVAGGAEKAAADRDAAIKRAEEALRTAEEALKRAAAVGTSFISNTLGISVTTAISETVSRLHKRADAARQALRGLIPPPAGTRPATRRGKCRNPLPPHNEVDCDVPNPASDSDLRNAHNSASSVLNDIAKAGELARASFEGKIAGALKELNAAIQDLNQKIDQASQALQAAQQ